ncbi:Pr6Pr family membrane protein [Cellulomonas sp. URHB0016]
MSVVVGLYRLALAAITLVALFWRPSTGLHLTVEDYVYFTNQSNLLMALLMLWGAAAAFTRRPDPPSWAFGAVTLFLLITGLVSYFILDPSPLGEEVIALGLTKAEIVHRLTPIATTLHFVLMVPHRRLRVRNAAWWLLYPVAYCAFSTLRGVLSPGSDYPYGFVDVSELGYGGLLTNVLVYSTGFFVLGLVVVGADRLLPARALLGRQQDAAPGSARPPETSPSDVPEPAR